MNTKAFKIFTLFLSLGFMSCHKSGSIVAPSSVTIVNALAGSDPIVPVFGIGNPPNFENAVQINYGSSQVYSPLSGNTSLSIKPITDTNHSIFNGNLDLKPGGIYSIYFSGNLTKPDTLLSWDIIPVHADSTVGIRFINLSPGSEALSINLIGTSDPVSAYNSLEYRKIGPFKSYPAHAGAASEYDFEIRNAKTGDVLATFNWSYSLFKNTTVVISGVENSGDNPIIVFTVNNY